MLFKIFKIRLVIWIGLLSTFTWWGGKAVIRYWNQPLTTDMFYSFGDNEKGGIQFPLISFCPLPPNFVENNILQECRDKSDRPYFIDSLTYCLETDENFKIKTFMDSLQLKRNDIIKTTRFWTGSGYKDLQYLDDEMWSSVFQQRYGLCYTFDPSSVKEYKYIPYPGQGRVGFEFLLAEAIPWKVWYFSAWNFKIGHTKLDCP